MQPLLSLYHLPVSLDTSLNTMQDDWFATVAPNLYDATLYDATPKSQLRKRMLAEFSTQSVTQQSQPTVNGSSRFKGYRFRYRLHPDFAKAQDTPLTISSTFTSSSPEANPSQELKGSNWDMQSSPPLYPPSAPSLVDPLGSRLEYPRSTPPPVHLQCSSPRYPRQSSPQMETNQDIQDQDVKTNPVNFDIMRFKLEVQIQTSDGRVMNMTERDGGGLDCEVSALLRIYEEFD